MRGYRLPASGVALGFAVGSGGAFEVGGMGVGGALMCGLPGSDAFVWGGSLHAVPNPSPTDTSAAPWVNFARRERRCERIPAAYADPRAAEEPRPYGFRVW